MRNTLDRTQREGLMPAERAWLSRRPDEVAGLRVLCLGEAPQTLLFRFDGWEFGRPQAVDDFVDVHVWVNGDSEWEAVFPGAVQASELLSIAALLLDAARGLPEVRHATFIDPSFTFAAWGDAGPVRFVRLDQLGTKGLLAGTMAPVTVEVTPPQLLKAAAWLVQEVARFLPGDMIARRPWIPADPAQRTGEVLSSMRASHVDSQPKTVDEAFARLEELTGSSLADPTITDSERSTMEFLARGVADRESAHDQQTDADGEL
jgi:hypothetical protein